MNDLSILVAVVGLALWLALGAFEATLAILERAGRLKWYRAERGARRTWLPTRITLPDYHPLYRWGAYNFYMRARD
jgi:hypothetical protein